MANEEAVKVNGVGVMGWGTLDEVWGLVEDVSDAPEATKKEIINGKGAVVGTVHTGFKRKLSLNYTPLVTAAEGAPPKVYTTLIGQAIEVSLGDGTKGKIIVDSCPMKWKKAGEMTFTVEGYIYPSLVFGA